MYAKLTSGAFSTILAGFLNAVALQQGFPWYRAFVSSVVLPHASLFAALVVLAELYVATAMLLGLTTRLAGAVAILLLVNYLCAKGMTPWSPASNDSADIVLSLVVAIGAAGRTFGLDVYLSKRFPAVA